jgi:cytochrome c
MDLKKRVERRRARALLLAALVFCASTGPGTTGEIEVLEGHGGPVMGLAVSQDGRQILSASFDYSVGLRDLDGGAPLWLEGHRAAVNAVAFLDRGRAVSASDDHGLILWDLETSVALRRMDGHKGKVVAVRVSPDGKRIASAGWDGRAGLWDARSGAHLAWIEGHDGRVNDVAFSSNGEVLFTSSDDGKVKNWDVQSGAFHRLVTDHGFGINRILVDPGGQWLAYGAVDRRTRVIALASGETVADLMPDRGPALALALNAERSQLAVGLADGHIMIVRISDWAVERIFRATRSGPVWALAFAPGGVLLAGGIGSGISLWPPDSVVEVAGSYLEPFHRPPRQMPNGERQFVRKCSICHSLGAGPDRKAGPPLGGLFDRRAGSHPAYRYSDVLSGADMIWTEGTVDALFREGPDNVVPGSKMPMQRIAAETDRADLIEYLVRATRVN